MGVASTVQGSKSSQTAQDHWRGGVEQAWGEEEGLAHHWRVGAPWSRPGGKGRGRG